MSKFYVKIFNAKIIIRLQFILVHYLKRIAFSDSKQLVYEIHPTQGAQRGKLIIDRGHPLYHKWCYAKYHKRFKVKKFE